MFLTVDGAKLYYEVRGSGPLLLIAQSGEGDAGRSVDLADRLVDRYTVVTYDRRGLSRSELAEPERGVRMTQHADDVHRLLAELTDRPALMLGCSMGASIGLHLAVRHPEQLAVLVAHEPVSPALLPAERRPHHVRELLDLQRVHRDGGLQAAVPEMARVLGIDPVNQEVEPDRTPMPMTPQRAANFAYFIQWEFTAVIQAELDVEAVAGSPVRIVPAVGSATAPDVFDRHCALELARIRETQAREFPGGHNGNTTHPRAYAARLTEVLGER
ncbi:alpha/beta hydrolase [Streptomyces sp. NPDC052225]|uniref:alpha/beta fold hydrolase n=1 Tax=Streptomyces sp. NPDC052225 TaxID=3154949 RepID=UPI003437FCA8